MKRVITLVLLALAACLPALGQGGTTLVKATVKDPNGALYTKSQVNITFFDPGTPGKIPLLNGSTFQKSYTIFGTDSFAFFSIQLPDNGIIDGSSGTVNTQWHFNICYSDGVTCFTYQTPINCAANIPTTCTSNTIDISAQLQAVAAILPNSSSGGGGQFSYVTVPYAANMTFSGNTNTAFKTTLTGNVSSSALSIAGAHPGLIFKFTVCQDGVGGHTFAWPVTFNNPPPVNGTANSCTNQAWLYNGTTWDPLSDASSQFQTRFQPLGTALSSGDFTTPSANGWGTGATISAIVGSDTAFQFTITAGTSPSIDPTVGLTFHDGAWISITTVNANMIAGTGNVSDIGVSYNTTSATLTYLDLPVATKTYTISVIVTGLSNVTLAGAVINPMLLNPLGPQTVTGFPTTFTQLVTFNSGLTGTGNIGSLDLGSGALNASHSWLATQNFPNGSIALAQLAPCANGQFIGTSGGIEGCQNGSGVNVNSSLCGACNFGNLPAAPANSILGVWQLSAPNASVSLPGSGNGSVFATVSGGLSAGHSPAIDGSGNIVDQGFPIYGYNSLGVDFSLTAGSNNNVLQVVISTPSSGCPCRAQAFYGLLLSTNNSGITDAAILDTGAGISTATFATSQVLVTGTASDYGTSASAYSRNTYPNSKTVTFTLTVNPTNAGSIVAKSTAKQGNPYQGTWLNVVMVPSN